MWELVQKGKREWGGHTLTHSVVHSQSFTHSRVYSAGYGDSCFLADRTYADMAADVTELLDHLQLDRAAIVGYSSGEARHIQRLTCYCTASPVRLCVCVHVQVVPMPWRARLTCNLLAWQRLDS